MYFIKYKLKIDINWFNEIGKRLEYNKIIDNFS